MIQFIEENNDAKTKLIEKLKEEICRIIKEIMTTKDTNEENELSNNNDLKDSISILKDSKNKLRFTKSAVSMQSFLCIQAQFINLIFTEKLLSSTSFQFRLIILFY